MNNFTKHQKSEHGGAGVKLTIVLLVLFLVAHAGYNYIPVAYEGENLKQEMQTAVIQGVAMPGSNLTAVDVIKSKIYRATVNNNVPSNALVEVKPFNNIVRAHVSYTKQVNILPFGIYKYNYRFDNTATPTGFLFKDDVKVAQQ
jgi:hypothetical protein